MFLGSEVYINFGILYIFVLLLIFRRSSLSREEVAIMIFYSLLQLLLVLSWVNEVSLGSASISDIPSLLRPVFLFILVLGFVLLYSLVNVHPVVILDCFVKASFSILVFYYVLETFGMVEFIKHHLWVRPRLSQHNYFTSFFVTTYFAAYFYTICFGYSVVRLLYRPSFSWFAISIGFLYFVVIAESKSFYVFSFIFAFLCIYIAFNKVFKIFALTIAFSLAVVAAYSFHHILELIVSTDLRSFRSIYTLLSNPEESITLQTRYSQIVIAVSGSFERGGLGVGLGRSISLESYIASFVYRYGLIGFSMYTLYFLSISCWAYRSYSASKNYDDKTIFLFVSIWFALLPLGLMSSPMYEMGKNSIFSAFIVSSFIWAKKYYVEKPRCLSNA